MGSRRSESRFLSGSRKSTRRAPEEARQPRVRCSDAARRPRANRGRARGRWRSILERARANDHARDLSGDSMSNHDRVVARRGRVPSIRRVGTRAASDLEELVSLPVRRRGSEGLGIDQRPPFSAEANCRWRRTRDDEGLGHARNRHEGRRFGRAALALTRPAPPRPPRVQDSGAFPICRRRSSGSRSSRRRMWPMTAARSSAPSSSRRAPSAAHAEASRVALHRVLQRRLSMRS